MLSLFDEAEPEIVEEGEPHKKLPSPFDFVNAIHHSKVVMIVDEDTEKAYNAYMVNRTLSFGYDTVIYANEMNRYPLLPKKAQFDFLAGAIPAKKRFNKWIKPEGNETIDLLKRAFRCSGRRAVSILPLLTEAQLDEIRESLEEGGKRGKGKTK